MEFKTIYRQGFLDGMRNSGKLAIDTTDDEIYLTGDWITAIERGYRLRDYENAPDTLAKYHRWYREAITQKQEVEIELEDTKELLRLANEKIEYMMNATQ